MDSLEIEGKEYISAKRAAREHSYTMDYIGQLIRGGKLTGKKVGRAWYVEQDSLQTYIASLIKAPIEKESVAQILTTDATPLQRVEIPMEQVQELREETATPTEVQYEPIHKQKVFEPVELSKEEERAYHYPMLSYLQDEKGEDLIPEIKSDRKEYKINIHTESESVAQQPIPVESVEPELEEEVVAREEVYVAPVKAQAPKTYQEIRMAETWGEKQVGARISYSPAKSISILPIVMGAALIVLFLGALGVSTFFIKTLNYESSTATVTEGVNYDNLLTESR